MKLRMRIEYKPWNDTFFEKTVFVSCGLNYSSVDDIICHEELQPEFINPEIHFTGISSKNEPNSNFTLEP